MKDYEINLLSILVPAYISYLIGIFRALPYKQNRKFRRKAIRKNYVTKGWIVEKGTDSVTYDYRIGKTLHSVDIDFSIHLNNKPEKIPENVTVYYLKPRANEILIEELSEFESGPSLIAFLIKAPIPIIVYILTKDFLFAFVNWLVH